MNTTEHLEKIKAKCEELIVRYKSGTGGAPPAIAGWRSTIAAIDFLFRCEMYSTTMAVEIIAAWQQRVTALATVKEVSL